MTGTVEALRTRAPAVRLMSGGSSMDIRWLMLCALLASCKPVRAQENSPAEGSDDVQWGICRDEDDPNECAAHARGVAKGDLGHGESLRGYAKACVDLISNAIQQKSAKV